MPTFVVEVMPKAELLDPQGKAVAGALARTGNGQFTNVRVGKRFEITTDAAADDATLAAIREIARDILSNQVIEDVVSITELTSSAADLAEAPAEFTSSVAELAEAPVGPAEFIEPAPSASSGTETSSRTETSSGTEATATQDRRWIAR